jgi:hypothetical protein
MNALSDEMSLLSRTGILPINTMGALDSIQVSIEHNTQFAFTHRL